MGNASVRARCLACIYVDRHEGSKPDHLWICTDVVKNNTLFEYQI